ncbi:MAG TPA: DUF1449 domain-containing protein [Cellvibrio sp.]|nr:DUF1449 domain-containing protein [Cellvibrio sp.]
MNEFLLTIFSFPTVIYTFFLGVAVLYWICAAFGLLELEILDANLPDVDGHLHAHAEHSFAETFAGILLRLGLNGVPVTVVITFIAIIGWLISYYLSYFELVLLGYGWVRFVVGIPILVFSFYIAILVTAQLIKPIRKLFAKTEQFVEKKILGQTAIVRSSVVNANAGEANFDDGGAGLIVKVRAMGEQQFKRGDRVVLLEYRAEEHVYSVISEAEFLGKEDLGIPSDNR